MQDFQDDTFQAGQVWKYKTRPGEENSTLTILKVEELAPSVIILHIALDGLKVKNPKAPGGTTESAGHLPFSKEAIVNSVTQLVSEKNELPEFMDGYNQWKEANGGVFGTDVCEVVKILEDALSGKQDE